jgi:hypothetical protein
MKESEVNKRWFQYGPRTVTSPSGIAYDTVEFSTCNTHCAIKKQDGAKDLGPSGLLMVIQM